MTNAYGMMLFESGEGEATGHLIATVNGETFEATTLRGFHVSDSENKGRFAIGRWPLDTDEPGQQSAAIQIVIREDLADGHYELPQEWVSVAYVLSSKYDDGSATWTTIYADSGSITFKYNHDLDKVTGTFGFRATDKKMLKPGNSSLATTFDITGNFSNELVKKKT